MCTKMMWLASFSFVAAHLTRTATCAKISISWADELERELESGSYPDSVFSPWISEAASTDSTGLGSRIGSPTEQNLGAGTESGDSDPVATADPQPSVDGCQMGETRGGPATRIMDDARVVGALMEGPTFDEWKEHARKELLLRFKEVGGSRDGLRGKKRHNFLFESPYAADYRAAEKVYRAVYATPEVDGTSRLAASLASRAASPHRLPSQESSDRSLRESSSHLSTCDNSCFGDDSSQEDDMRVDHMLDVQLFGPSPSTLSNGNNRTAEPFAQHRERADRGEPAEPGVRVRRGQTTTGSTLSSSQPSRTTSRILPFPAEALRVVELFEMGNNDFERLKIATGVHLRRHTRQILRHILARPALLQRWYDRACANAERDLRRTSCSVFEFDDVDLCNEDAEQLPHCNFTGRLHQRSCRWRMQRGFLARLAGPHPLSETVHFAHHVVDATSGRQSRRESDSLDEILHDANLLSEKDNLHLAASKKFPDGMVAAHTKHVRKAFETIFSYLLPLFPVYLSDAEKDWRPEVESLVTALEKDALRMGSAKEL